MIKISYIRLNDVN